MDDLSIQMKFTLSFSAKWCIALINKLKIELNSKNLSQIHNKYEKTTAYFDDPF